MCSLSDTRNNVVYGMSGLFFIFWTVGIPKDYWEADLPSGAAGKLCPPAVPPSTANTHGCDCFSWGCVCGPTAGLGGGGSLEPLLQALATGWISLISLPAGSLPRKAHEELRGKVWMVPHSVCSSINGSAPRQGPNYASLGSYHSSKALLILLNLSNTLVYVDLEITKAQKDTKQNIVWMLKMRVDISELFLVNFLLRKVPFFFFLPTPPKPKVFLYTGNYKVKKIFRQNISSVTKQWRFFSNSSICNFAHEISFSLPGRSWHSLSWFLHILFRLILLCELNYFLIVRYYFTMSYLFSCFTKQADITEGVRSQLIRNLNVCQYQHRC